MQTLQCYRRKSNTAKLKIHSILFKKVTFYVNLKNKTFAVVKIKKEVRPQTGFSIFSFFVFCFLFLFVLFFFFLRFSH